MSGRKIFRYSLEERARKERRGGFFDSDAFRDVLLDRIRKSGGKEACVGGMPDEQEAERIIELGLGIWGLQRGDLQKMPKGKQEKIAIACLIRERTMMTNGWIAKQLHMGDPSRVCRYCSAGRENRVIQKLANTL